MYPAPYPASPAFCLIPVAVFLCCSLINMAAPGNRIRGEYYAGIGTSPVQAILQSFVAGAQFIVRFTDAFTVLMLVLLAPILWQILRRAEQRLPNPLLMLLFSFAVVSAGFTSSIYTGAGLYLSRLHNSVRLMYQVLLVVNEGCILAWIQRRMARQKQIRRLDQIGIQRQAALQNQTDLQNGITADAKSPKGCGRRRDHNMPLLLLLPVVVLMYCTVRFSTNPLGTFTTFAATYQVEDDALYYQEYLERQNLLEASAGKDVVVKPYTHQPWLLYVFEITEDPSNYYNEWMRDYYHLNSVRLDPQAQTNTATQP